MRTAALPQISSFFTSPPPLPTQFIHLWYGAEKVQPFLFLEADAGDSVRLFPSRLTVRTQQSCQTAGPGKVAKKVHPVF